MSKKIHLSDEAQFYIEWYREPNESAAKTIYRAVKQTHIGLELRTEPDWGEGNLTSKAYAPEELHSILKEYKREDETFSDAIVRIILKAKEEPEIRTW